MCLSCEVVRWCPDGDFFASCIFMSVAADIRRGKKEELECGPMPNVMVARPLFNVEVWLTPTTRVPCSNAAKTRKPLKFAGVPETCQQISAVSRPKFTILRGHVEEVSVFNKFFSNCRYTVCLSCEDIARAKMVIFASCIFSEPRAAHFRHAF